MATSAPQTLDRPGGRIAFEVAGDGPLVLCLPGMGELRSSYRYTMPALIDAGFRVAAMDLRGHGDSDATFPSYDDVSAGQDALAVIDRLTGPAVVIGNSMGAGAAVWAAAERPGSISGLGLLGPFVRNTPTNVLLTALFKVMTSGPWAPRMWTAYLPRLYPGRRPPDFAEHRSAIAASMRRPGHTKAFTATTRTSHAPVAARIADVHCPALVVMGEKDPDFADPAAEAQWIGEHLPAEVAIVPGAGHYPQVEYPEIVNPQLVAFCKRVAPSVA